MGPKILNLFLLLFLVRCCLLICESSLLSSGYIVEQQSSSPRGLEITRNKRVRGRSHYFIPNEIFYSTQHYNLAIPINLVYYGDYINDDYDYLLINQKYRPRTIGTCGHFVPKNKTPKYTILALYGALDTYSCSSTSIKFFRKFVNYTTHILGPELAENSQIIVIDWLRLVFDYNSMKQSWKNELGWIKMIIRYYISSPKHRNVIVPAISITAFINKLSRNGVIPSMADTGLYGLCLGGLNSALSTLLLKQDLNIVAINGPPLFIPDKFDRLFQDKIRKNIGTKYFVVFAKGDRTFHYRRHGKSLANFISKYAQGVDYLKVKGSHEDLILTHIYTCIGVIATSLLRKAYSIILFNREKYSEIPKKFNQNYWKRYVMYDARANKN